MTLNDDITFLIQVGKNKPNWIFGVGKPEDDLPNGHFTGAKGLASSSSPDNNAGSGIRSLSGVASSPADLPKAIAKMLKKDSKRPIARRRRDRVEKPRESNMALVRHKRALQLPVFDSSPGPVVPIPSPPPTNVGLIPNAECYSYAKPRSWMRDPLTGKKGTPKFEPVVLEPKGSKLSGCDKNTPLGLAYQHSQFAERYKGFKKLKPSNVFKVHARTLFLLVQRHPSKPAEWFYTSLLACVPEIEGKACYHSLACAIDMLVLVFWLTIILLKYPHRARTERKHLNDTGCTLEEARERLCISFLARDFTDGVPFPKKCEAGHPNKAADVRALRKQGSLPAHIHAIYPLEEAVLGVYKALDDEQQAAWDPTMATLGLIEAEG